MVLQMLTRREVARSHYPWQLMTKHAMWMAFEHRRQLDGLPEQRCSGCVPVSMLEATPQDSGGVPVNGDDDISLHSAADDQEDGASDAGGGLHNRSCDDQKQCGSGEASVQGKVPFKIRHKSNTFYDDYLHRGAHEVGPNGEQLQTPLRNMSYIEYGMFVKVVLGDPWNLQPRQYAFAEHHDKLESNVQELRVAPVVPFIHGFTLPTKAKDPETNALFKQLLFRPHRCRGPGH